MSAPLSLHKARDPRRTHESLDTLAADPDVMAEAQLGVDSPRARAWIRLILSVSQTSVSSRSQGGRRSQAWKAVLFTPTTRHISETGYEAFSAAINR
jgi:hypothetical protein